MLIERILLSRHLHPCKDDGTAAGYDIGQTLRFFEPLCRTSVDSHMDRHKVHAVFCMHLHNLDPFLRGDLTKRFMIVNDCIIDRHSSDDRRTLCSQLSAELLGIAEGTQIHNGLRAHLHRVVDLLHLHIHILPVSGSSQIYIDLRLQHRTDAVDIQTGMQLVCRDRNLSFRHKPSQLFHIHLFFLSDTLHFFCDNTFSGSVHLCRVIHIHSHPFCFPGVSLINQKQPPFREGTEADTRNFVSACRFL